MEPAEIRAALDRMYRRTAQGIKMDLAVAQQLANLLGHPERTFVALHVAGTNGKGSVAAILESILRARAFRCGLYTSPHLVRFNERIRVQGVEIADAALAPLIERVESLCPRVAQQCGREPTFFETTTAMAFEAFRRAELRVAVVETGMGGRLDATNVLTPVVSVITRISMDHMQYLGNDLASIVREKCGIIKPGTPVVLGENAPDVVAQVRAAARMQGAPLVYAPERVSVRRMTTDWSGQKCEVETADQTYGTLKLPLLGDHQLENLATALAAMEAFQSFTATEISAQQVRAGVAAVQWPGRLQVFGNQPPVLLDGAHNPGATEALLQSLRRLAGRRPIGIVFGACADKDIAGMLKILAPATTRAWMVRSSSSRAEEPARLVELARGAGFREISSAPAVASALEEARGWAAAAEGIVCVTGSLFLVGDVLRN